MINKISKKLSIYIALHTSISLCYEDIEVLQYGIECVINTTCSTLLILLFCFHSHTLFSGIIWIFLFTFLRNQVGGYHATNHLMCIILSTILCIITILTSIKIVFTSHQIVCIEILALTIISRIAPISSSKNNPLSPLQQKHTKQNALLLSFLCFVICFIGIPYSSLIILIQISVIILAIIEITKRSLLKFL